MLGDCRALDRNALHSPIVDFLAYALYLVFAAWGIDLGSALKFGIAVVIVVRACFAVPYLMRSIPGVSRVVLTLDFSKHKWNADAGCAPQTGSDRNMATVSCVGDW